MSEILEFDKQSSAVFSKSYIIL